MIQQLFNYFKRKPPNQKKLFIDVLREYIDRYVSENDFCEGTKSRYEVYYRNIAMFLAMTKTRDTAISEVRIKLMEDLRVWLRTNLVTCTITHASRHLELCKRVTNYAVKMEYCINDALSPLEGRRDRAKEIIFLEQSEVKKIIAYNFQNAFMQATADLFIFQCSTGVSYKDIYEHEIVERNGHTLIIGKRKGDVQYEARVFKEAKDILKKYNGKLPVIPNQRYNMRLKEIANILNINKHLTTHVARKTHATILTERGANTKIISLQLGNTERVVEKHYVGRSNKIIESELTRIGIGDSLLTA